MRDEDWLREQLKTAFKGFGAHVSWIESHETSAGFPDLDFMCKGQGTQIELKVTKKDGSIKIRAGQYAWFRDRARAGGSPYMWVFDNETHLHYAIRASEVATVERIEDVRDAVFVMSSHEPQLIIHQILQDLRHV